MGANVFANGREISGKASANKTIAAMPDVCMSPPSPPAGPIPIPYPNFAQASDTTGGSKKVKIGNKEVGLKGKSSYKKSKGDEAATRSFGASVISHTIQGSAKHQAGSFDVKIEGSNVVRFGDITTGNHGSPGMPVAPDVAAAAIAKVEESECEKLSDQNKDKRTNIGHDFKPTTITHFSINAKKIFWTCSRNLANKYKNSSLMKGLQRLRTSTVKGRGKMSEVVDAKRRAGERASNMCDEARKKFKYKTTKSHERPHTSHTESRIIEDLFAKGPPKQGTLVLMSINWLQEFTNPKSKGKSYEINKNPCDDCHKLLCAAQECGIIIALCDDDNKAKSIEDKTGEPCA